MRDKKKKERPEVHNQLEKFDIYIDEFGQVKSTLSQETLNTFLNEEVEDKKFSPKAQKQLEDLYREEE